jgi:hypothetical protein
MPLVMWLGSKGAADGATCREHCAHWDAAAGQARPRLLQCQVHHLAVRRGGLR